MLGLMLLKMVKDDEAVKGNLCKGFIFSRGLHQMLSRFVFCVYSIAIVYDIP